MLFVIFYVKLTAESFLEITKISILRIIVIFFFSCFLTLLLQQQRIGCKFEGLLRHSMHILLYTLEINWDLILKIYFWKNYAERVPEPSSNPRLQYSIYSKTANPRFFYKHSLFSWKLLEKGPWTKDLIISLFWSPQIGSEIVFCQILPHG